MLVSVIEPTYKAPTRVRSGRVLPQPGAAGASDGLGSVGDLELAEDDRDMVANRLLRQEELTGDPAVVEASGHQVEHLPLPLAQLGEHLAARLRSEPAEPAAQPRGDRRAEDGTTGGDGGDGVEQVGATGSLDDVAPRAGP